MKKKRWILVFAVLALIAVVVVVVHLPLKEPVYQGKTSRYWFDTYESVPGGPIAKQASAAFDEMGSNAVPFLTAKITPRNFAIREWYYSTWLRAPTVLRRYLPVPRSPYQEQLDAVTLVREMGSPARAAVPDLVLIIEADPRYVRTNAMSAGVMSKGTSNAQRGWSAGYAISSGRGVTTELRIRALGALASMAGDDAGAFAALFDVLHDVDPAITSAVEKDPIQNFAWGFRRLAPELVAGCIRWLDDPSEVVRAAAVQLLVRAGDHYRDVVGALARRLADPSERVRDNTKETFAGLSHKSDLVVQLLVDALWSLDPPAQRSGAEILAEIGPKAKAAVPLLTQVLKSPDRAARYQAALALWKIEGRAEALIPFRIEEVKDSTPKLVAGDARTTGLHYAQTFTFRDGRLESPTTTARLDAVSFLGRCGPAAKTAVPALIELLHDQDEQLQEAAVNALGDIGPAARPAVPALMQALHARWFTVRDAAAEALKRIDLEAAAKAGIK